MFVCIVFCNLKEVLANIELLDSRFLLKVPNTTETNTFLIFASYLIKTPTHAAMRRWLRN